VEAAVAAMRRYCIDYTSGHDQSVCDEIMAPDYEITVSGQTMAMDAYRRAVSAAFRRYPTLALTVHDLLLSGDRLAMRFSEHGAADGDPDRVAVWQGIALYRWGDGRLRSCRVEQDFAGRDAQASSGATAPLEPAHPDPWATTRDTAPDPSAEAALHAWLQALAADPAATLADPRVHLLEHGGDGAPLLAQQRITVDDLFSAGNRVAAAISIAGVYDGGLDGVDATATGRPGVLPATLLATAVDGDVHEVWLVRDRWGLVRRLRDPR